MPGPIAGVRFIHVALEREAAAIEEQAVALHDAHGARALDDRVAFFERVNAYHTQGEELAIFPRLQEIAPHQAEPYLIDHEDERALFAEIRTLLAHLASAPMLDAKAHARVARQTAALHDALALHIRKENELLVPLLDMAFPVGEQAAIVGKVIAAFPPAEMPLVLPWLVGWLSPADRESYMREMTRVAPPPVVAMAAGWLAAKLPADAWEDLKRRLPELGA